MKPLALEKETRLCAKAPPGAHLVFERLQCYVLPKILASELKLGVVLIQGLESFE